MRQYDIKEVERLNREGKILDVNGVKVELKEVPVEHTGSLDPRVKAFEEKMIGDMKEREATGEHHQPTVEEMREMMGGANFNLNTVEIYTKYIEVPTTYGKVPVWIHYPRHMKGKRPALLYVHGGAFLGGTPFTLENHCRLIAERANCVTFNIDYSLAPENPYPIPCTQVYEVLSYVYEHGEEYSVDTDKISIAGDSAGGNISAACAQMDLDKNTHYLAHLFLLYAKLTFSNHETPGYQRDESAFDISEEEKEYLPGLLHIGSDESNAGDERIYVQGKYDVKEPYISPVFGEKDGHCPTTFFLAEFDGLRLEGEFFAKQLQEAHIPVRVVRYEGISHGFFDKLGILPQAEAVVNEIVKEVQAL